MKNWVLKLVAGLCLPQLGIVACWAAEPSPSSPLPSSSSPKPTLVIATYDSLVAKHGLGPAIFPLFERRCGCTVKTIASGDGAQLLSRLQLEAERAKPQIQVVLGLDQATWERARPYLEAWEGWKPKGTDRLAPQLSEAFAAGKTPEGFLPFDYGVFAFMSDREALAAAKLESPRRLADLLRPEWKRNVILEDPRTSTPGLAFLLYAQEVGGEGFWSRFRSQWLTLAPGWDGAYGLFLKKEAPLVWSYTTSQAYHEAHGDRADEQRRYRALVFEEGNPVQVEGAALVKGALGAGRSRALARQFLEFLLSPEVQALVPEKNWMLPAVAGTPVPASFKKIPGPLKIVRTASDAKAVERSLDEWKKAVSGGR